MKGDQKWIQKAISPSSKGALRKKLGTKKGENMMFIKIGDYTGNIEAVVFPRTLTEHKDLFITDQCVAVKGKITTRNGTRSIIVEKAKKLAAA